MFDIETQIEELKKRTGTTSYKELADFLEISPGAIQNWKTRNKIPDKVLRQVDKILSDSALTVAQQAVADTVIIPQYDLTVSAGGGSYVIAENPIANFTFSRDWIINHGLHNKQLTIVPVKGDSMENELHDGDLLIVSVVEDMRDAREGVCVVRYDDEVFVKRVHYDWQRKGYDIISDNEKYKPRYIPEQDIIDGRFVVCGKMEFKLQRTKNL